MGHNNNKDPGQGSLKLQITIMSSLEYLKEFVHERLTAAAEEIFAVFKRTIDEYEEEVVRQRKMLAVVWKPEMKLLRTGYNLLLTR